MNKPRLSLLMISAAVLFTEVASAQAVPINKRINEMGFTRGTSVASVAEVHSVDVIADVGGALGGKYFTLCAPTPTGETCYAPWIDVDNGSTAPTVANHTLIEIDISADDDAEAVGNAVQTVLHAHAAFTATDDDAGAVTVTNVSAGSVTNAAAGTSGFTVATDTQGVSPALAIASASVLANLMAWQICNDPDNGSSDWLDIGSTLDQSNGTRIAEGECFQCPNCTPATLRAVRVSSEGGSNGFTVVQLR